MILTILYSDFGVFGIFLQNFSDDVNFVTVKVDGTRWSHVSEGIPGDTSGPC